MLWPEIGSFDRPSEFQTDTRFAGREYTSNLKVDCREPIVDAALFG